MNCILIRPLWIWLKKLIKALLVLFGIISLLMFLLSLTSIPFWAHYNLGIYGDTFKKNPEVIVVLGGSGMPSSEGLMRTYYASKVAMEFPDIPVIVALPGDTMDSNSSVRKMAYELEMRGIDSIRIRFENVGTNTRWEAINIKNRFFPSSSPRLLIVSSPAHMYRAVKTFKKVGFEKVGGIASFNSANETALEYDAISLGGKSAMPDVGNKISLRYAIWNRMHLQLTVIREYLAIGYYWMMGWI